MPPEPRRAWDAYDAYLFDVDGTLLTCKDAVHYFAFCNALSRVAGRPLNLDGVVAHGNVDTGILRDALALAGVPDEQWRPQLSAMCDGMGAEVERNQAELRPEVLPGVVALLRHLHARGAVLGIATGNLARIGRLKLSRCGLLRHFDVQGYSDGWETRSDVFAAALASLREVVGGSAAVCVVGDTPADIQAARANRLDVIAVATGVYPREQLAAADPTWCVASLTMLLK